MKKAVIVLCIFLISGMAYADGVKSVITKSLISGVYEDGNYTRKHDGFQAELLIDQDTGKIWIRKVIRNDREGRVDKTAAYEITNTVLAKGPSALLVSRNKKDQTIITAVREAGLGASETLIIGDDFYEFCRAENGKFYLEYGEVLQRRGSTLPVK